jgi:hypothetical protein
MNKGEFKMSGTVIGNNGTIDFSGGSNLNVEIPASFQGDITLGGNVTLGGDFLTMPGVVQTGGLRQVITVGTALSVDNSGATLIPGGTAQTFTLPVATSGVHFKMYAGTAAAHKLQVTGSARIYGNAINTNNAQAEMAEGQKIDNSSSVAFTTAFQTGDFMEVVSDGNNWFIHAVTNDPLTLT